ncbi:sporulation protein YpjB [Jeotgalibacillus sp. ET6]|uniref:sporulation protein YpjB n=1 Tax=Jeotgalibacillus sp. ET6 TaxID=3037260 RepID=UPI0024185C4D|nr:sporulation protein YpjB [Jeotgalibacillus sp. ET6]MDG5470632.1 sporulation protein YpjB [Jeotgalibacillus sp. ET6]
MKRGWAICILIILFAGVPLQTTYAETEFNEIFQYISSKDYEEGVLRLNDWYLTLSNEQREPLEEHYSKLISVLSSNNLMHKDKLIQLWSFLSAAEYITEDRVYYLRYLNGYFHTLADNGGNTGTVEDMNKVYDAMLPVLHMMAENNDMEAIKEASVSEEDLVMAAAIQPGNSVPPFQIWYEDHLAGSNLVLVSTVTGGVLISALTYASWRKYVGEKRRKRIRNHSD